MTNNQTVKLPFYRRLVGHFLTITKHKIKVTQLCFQMGLYKQGILHDLSKYSPVEFCAGVRYWQGDRSPIDKEKEILGYSYGWLHHKGHNMHHWEYWMDRSREGIIFHEAPKHVVKEMICDRVAACMIYQKDRYTDKSALIYFEHSNDKELMNQKTAALIRKYLTWIAEDGLKKGINRIRQD
ncbi:MAG: DUF5662 family protein [Erysipelotrichaceae bacterium]|nr:DUF5662 family protein [Erysipelotrichaceae bacterium]